MEESRSDADIQYGDGGLDTNILNSIFVALGGAGAAVGLLKYGGSLLLEWIKNRTGRSVELKFGDKEIRITGTTDIQKALDALKALEEISERKTDGSDGETVTYSN